MNVKRTIKILVMLGGLVAGSYYGYQALQNYSTQKSDIRSYGTPEDEAFIKSEFKENFYIFTPVPNFDIDFVLKTKSPNNREPQYFGKMTIKMLYHQGRPVGFVTYYMETTYQGRILFLGIDKNERGKRYGEKLLKYAFAQLKKEGAKTVKIFTRTENLPAQKLYTRLGFVPFDYLTGQEMPKEGGIFYRMEL